MLRAISVGRRARYIDQDAALRRQRLHSHHEITPTATSLRNRRVLRLISPRALGLRYVEPWTAVIVAGLMRTVCAREPVAGLHVGESGRPPRTVLDQGLLRRTPRRE